VGEIIARSKHIMVEYWHKPEETKESLIDGWVHTGDMGHYDERVISTLQIGKRT